MVPISIKIISMKKVSVFIVSLFMAVVGLQAQEWKPVQLMEKVVVSMPGEVQEQSMGPQKIKKVVLADSTEIGGAVIDFGAFGLNEDMLSSMMETDEFKEQLKTGISASGGKVIAETSGKYLDKHFYYQFDMEQEKDGKKFKTTTRLVFYKASGISLNFKDGKNASGEKTREQFFNSLKIEE